MTVLVLILFMLLCLYLMAGLFVQPITQFVQHYWPNFTYEGEQFLLWGGMMLSAVEMGLLSVYLFLP